jgi:hypothetical protein
MCVLGECVAVPTDLIVTRSCSDTCSCTVLLVMDAAYMGDGLDIHIYYYHESVGDVNDQANAYRLSRQLPSVHIGHKQDRCEQAFIKIKLILSNIRELCLCSDGTRKTWHFFRFALSPTNITRDNLQLCLDIYADDHHLTDIHLRCHRIQVPISCSAVRNLCHLIILSIIFTLYSIYISNA